MLFDFQKYMIYNYICKIVQIAVRRPLKLNILVNQIIKKLIKEDIKTCNTT